MPRRMPTKLKALHGSGNVTLDRDRTDQNFPCLPENTIIEAPTSLSARAAATWYSVTEPLIAVGALQTLDLEMLEEGLRLQDELQDLNEQITKLMAKKKKVEADYTRWNKLSAMRNRSLQTYFKIMSAFGVTPSARAGIANLVRRPMRTSEKEKEENAVLAVLND